MPGPLPDASRRRRNAPSIPTTKLPVSGRKGRPPNPPYELGAAGRAWWRWAWGLPQAMAWDSGALYALGRRAQLEDDLAALEHLDIDPVAEALADLVGANSDDERIRNAIADLKLGVQRLKSLAGGRLGIVKEMRELDKRFGLDPKALAENRWEIVPDEDDKKDAKPKAASGGGRRARLSVVAG